MRPQILLSFVGYVLLISGQVSRIHAAEEINSDVEWLNRTGIGTSDAALVDFLRKAVSTGEDVKHIDELIKQLGANDFKEREEASHRLIALGYLALSQLKTALRSEDLETVRRAKDCIEAIGRNEANPSPRPAVVRQTLLRKPEGGAEVLLAFLPYAVNEIMEEEILFGLNAWAEHDAKVLATIAKTLTDPDPIRKAGAACIVGKSSDKELRDVVIRLLKDRSPLVRLRAAQGLLTGREKTGIPVLIDLLNEPAIEISWQAEELLHWVAGDEAPMESVGAATAESRLKCRTKWQEWWKKEGEKVNLANVLQERRRPGLQFTCVSDDQRKGRVYLCGYDGLPRWQLGNEVVGRPVDIQLLARNRVLLAEIRSDEGQGRASERDLQGKLIREMPGSWYSCRRLANGNTLLFGILGLSEIGPDGEDISIRNGLRSDDGHREDGVNVVDKLDNGRLLCLPAFGAARVFEFDPVTKKVVKQITIKDRSKPWFNPQFRPHALSNGHLMIAQSEPGKIYETDADGKTIWECMITNVNKLDVLPNGNVLAQRHNRLVEINRQGKAVWEFLPAGYLIKASQCLGLVRLGFSQPVGVDLDQFELESNIRGLKSKDLAIRLQAVEEFKNLGSKALPTVPHLTKALKDPEPKMRSQVAHCLGTLGPKAKAAIPDLIEALNFPDAEEAQDSRLYAAVALADIGPCAIPLLLRALKDDRKNMRLGIAYALGCLAQEEPNCLPTLIDFMKDEDPKIRGKTLWFLGRLSRPDQKVISIIAEALRDKDTKVCRDAAFTLFSMQQPYQQPPADVSIAIPQLLQAAKADDSQVRAYALRALGWIGPKDRAIIPALREGLKDNNSLVVECAAEAIGQIGPPANLAVPDLIGLLRAKDIKRENTSWSVHSNVACALGAIGPKAAKEAVPILLEMLQSKECKDLQVRGVIASALTKMGLPTEKGIPILLGELNSYDGTTGHEVNTYRDCLISSLLSLSGNNVQRIVNKLLMTEGNGGLWSVLQNMQFRSTSDQGILQALTVLARSGNDQIAMAAILALAPYGSEAKAVVPTLCESLKDNNAGIRVRAEFALAHIEPSNELLLPVLIQDLHAEKEFNPMAAWALGLMGSSAKSALPALVKEFKEIEESESDYQRHFRGLSIHMLKPFGGGERSFHQFQWDAGACILEAINRIGSNDKESISLLTRIIKNSKADLSRRCLAAETLAKIGSSEKSVLPLLLSVLKDEENPALLQTYAATALGTIGPEAKDALPLLQECLKERNREVRLAAGKALAKIQR
jgi:HEAT repeat protein